MIGVGCATRQASLLAHGGVARVDCRVPLIVRVREHRRNIGIWKTMSELWRRCLERLETEFGAEDVHTYLKPLQASEGEQGVRLFAPNAYTLDAVR